MFTQLFSYLAASWRYALAHKFISLAVAAAIIGGGYYAYTSLIAEEGETRYVLQNVERGTITASVSGSGQVSASSQVDVTAKTGGDLVALNAAVGQTVKAGATLAQVDARDAAYELETARLSYDELVALDPDDVRAAEDAFEDAQAALVDSYVGARATLAVAATDMENVLDGLDEMFASGAYLYNPGGSSLTTVERASIEKARDQWYAANDSLEKFAAAYRTLSNNSDDATVRSVLVRANATAQAVAEAAKYAKDAVAVRRERLANDPTGSEAYITVTDYVTSANATLADTQGAVNDLATKERALRSAEDELADLREGPDELDVRSEELSVRQKQQAYADHFIRAPFDGIVAAVPVRRGENVSSGTTVATLITTQKVAEISLNEVDAAKIELGQKAELSFDAIDGLAVTGEVLEVDLIGTVSQGVVNYTVKIGFDTEDERIKPGMTVNASIVVSEKSGVLAVPSSAVKTQGARSYVLAFDPSLSDTGGARGVTSSRAPQQIAVEIGLSDDENVEILSGLSEGQQIVARTLTGTAQTTTSTNGGFGGPPVRF